MERYADLLTVLPLAAAARQDLITRQVPDWTVGVLAAVGLLARGVDGPRQLMFSVAGAAVLFGILLVIYARRAIGGGDVKLATAIALGLAPLAMLHFVVATVLAGGVLGLLYLPVRQRRPVRPAGAGAGIASRLWAIERWRARRRGIPYAIAIGIGASCVLLLSARP